MEWEGGRRSDNIEDRRGQGGLVPGMGRGVRIGRGGGIGGIGLVAVLIIGWLMGVNPLALLGMLEGGGGGPVVVDQSGETESGPPPQGDRAAEFVSVVLADTEDTWHQQFQQRGMQYEEPKLVLFTDQTDSACGYAQGATGPFYCPGDRRVYLDIGFFQELSQRFGAPGDFAQAYVIAHEVGHHVQNLLGILPKVHEIQTQSSEAQANELSVRLELQADCLAGVWANQANRTRQIVQEGDIEEAMNAAAAVGDDRIMRAAGRRASPEKFTHGSSEQRVRWFTAGLKGGNMDSCNTFDANVQL